MESPFIPTTQQFGSAKQMEEEKEKEKKEEWDDGTIRGGWMDGMGVKSSIRKMSECEV